MKGKDPVPATCPAEAAAVRLKALDCQGANTAATPCGPSTGAGRLRLKAMLAANRRPPGRAEERGELPISRIISMVSVKAL
jgi:hypothetical protein